MAAYAALVSLFNNLDHIHNHPHFSTSFDKYQMQSLGEHIDFLLDFVESYNIDGDLSTGAEEVRRQIARAAHEAEDIIESHIVNQIFPETADISDVRLHHKCLFGLQKVIQNMDSIKEEVVKIKEESGFNYQKPPNSRPVTSSIPPTTEQNWMVGFEDELMQLKDVLIGQQSSRQIISIVGMGGTGKTTLAKHVYEDSLTRHHFDLRAWATISQDCDAREILLQLLSVAGGNLHELGERLHKSLFGRRYLIILDDMWSMEVWDRIRFFFPDNSNGSRIVITTRLSNVAIQLRSICIRINFLDENKSWNLFCQKIFDQEDCPVELERIGKKIVEQCKGLPLSIVVIGGLLKKSRRTEDYWQSVSRNINSILYSREYEQCFNVLYLSYSHLPAHLKPCFLYMGTFEEDSEICVSQIINLWVAEGFLKPKGVQILEEMAEDYLNDLIDRNLILVCAKRSNGKMRSFCIHDLLRELCLRVADKEKFFCVVWTDNIPQDIERERRLKILDDYTSSFPYNKVCKAFQSTSLARSLICDEAEAPSGKCRLLRVFNGRGYDFRNVFQNVNLRYVVCQLHTLPSSISLIWNLQTLVIESFHPFGEPIAPLEIWMMTQLRHLKCFNVVLSDPPPSDDKDDSVVLGKLHTLVGVKDFRLSKEVCKRIRNIKKLRFSYGENIKVQDYSWDDNLQNLGRLQRLESIHIRGAQKIPISKLNNAFSSSLNKLVLVCRAPSLEELSVVIGSLPELEVLKVRWLSDQLQKWNCVERGFLRLKFLSIVNCALESWTLEGASHFPALEKLVLIRLAYLNEIPSGIGEIPTLQLIRLIDCTESLVISAMKIKEEQEDFGNDGFQIQVTIFPDKRERFRERVEVEGLSIKNIILNI